MQGEGQISLRQDTPCGTKCLPPLFVATHKKRKSYETDTQTQYFQLQIVRRQMNRLNFLCQKAECSSSDMLRYLISKVADNEDYSEDLIFEIEDKPERTVRCWVRLTESEIRAFEAAKAAQPHSSSDDYIRSLVLRAVKHEEFQATEELANFTATREKINSAGRRINEIARSANQGEKLRPEVLNEVGRLLQEVAELGPGILAYIDRATKRHFPDK